MVTAHWPEGGGAGFRGLRRRAVGASLLALTQGCMLLGYDAVAASEAGPRDDPSGGALALDADGSLPEQAGAGTAGTAGTGAGGAGRVSAALDAAIPDAATRRTDAGGVGPNAQDPGGVDSSNDAAVAGVWAEPSCGYRVRLSFDTAALTETLSDVPVLAILDESRIDYAWARP